MCDFLPTHRLKVITLEDSQYLVNEGLVFLFGQGTFGHLVASNIEDSQRVTCLLVHLDNLGNDMVDKGYGVGFGYINDIIGVVLCRQIDTLIESAIGEQCAHRFLAGTHVAWHIDLGYHAYMTRTCVL